ncbi:MAG: adenylosuccinate synthetase [Candidatus Daviesbacteria bacterium]|nr:adenylosuccinate synthetase [Candidatus Daviesbacteria bacterium]
MKKIRKNSFAFCGGVYGDEGKGRIVDEYVDFYSKKGSPVIVYRDNGGANAGHTIELTDGRRLAMHLLPSGILCKSAKVILGKGMVIHPEDLLTEINEVKEHNGDKICAQIIIDENTYLALDTHRAYEAALKNWQKGGSGATGRGIAPAYADILLRHPLQIKDIAVFNENKISRHYRLYQALLKGLGVKLSTAKVPAYNKTELQTVGTEQEFVKKLEAQGKLIKGMVEDINASLGQMWSDEKKVFIFEKAQAIGLDCRYGVYPDITASDTTFDGIFSSTEGIVDPDQIGTRAAVIKATYMSSVGSRILPTIMGEKLAAKIREDAHEYGATTKRPRDIAYIDLPALRFFTRVGNVNSHILTHMDIVYPNTPIKICTKYKINGKEVEYRPSQEYLLKVKPEFIELETWDQAEIQKAKSYKELPKEAKKYLDFIAKNLNSKISMITTGPQRNQSIKIP